jgi:UDP-N-acetylmuramoylalanine--D-glutamate ligase
LASAISSAAADASLDPAREPVVLLSPACASYDQFQNFERRGDAFRTLVRSLEGVVERGEAA